MANVMLGAQAQQSQVAAQPQGSPLEALTGHYDKLQGAEAMLGATREVLDSLAKLGDAVTVEDVVKGAGKLVAKGLDPAAMATLLSEMPEKPELLAEWISQHDQQVTQREEDLKKVQLVVRHQMGVEALGALSSHAAEPPQQLEPQGPPTGGDLALGGS